jgi:hypothetical protein
MFCLERHLERDVAAKTNIDMLTLLLLLTGTGCFWLFFRSVDFFENI